MLWSLDGRGVGHWGDVSEAVEIEDGSSCEKSRSLWEDLRCFGEDEIRPSADLQGDLGCVQGFRSGSAAVCRRTRSGNAATEGEPDCDGDTSIHETHVPVRRAVRARQFDG